MWNFTVVITVDLHIICGYIARIGLIQFCFRCTDDGNAKKFFFSLAKEKSAGEKQCQRMVEYHLNTCLYFAVTEITLNYSLNNAKVDTDSSSQVPSFVFKTGNGLFVW